MPRILVVDDESNIRELIRKTLNMEGYEVTTVPTPSQALDAVEHNSFDLVVLDIVMREESGIATLKKMRESGKTMPIVIFSGYITIELEEEARLAGANEVLRKDFGIFQLVERIGRILKAKEQIFERSLRWKEKGVLIVDDDGGIRKLLRGFLEMKGCRVLEAESGERALELAASDNISAVLLDIQMPGMDGIATLKRLLEIDPKLGVVMVTAVLDDERVEAAMKLGAYSYILKPFDFLYLELVVMSKLIIAEGS